MKTIKLFFILVVIFAAANVIGQTKENMKEKKYAELWKTVDSCKEKNLPKSALEAVDKIYQLAKKDKNEDQVIKAFIHKMMFSNTFEENAFEVAIKQINAEIKTATFPSKNIFHSMLAEMYSMYYNANRWKWHNRSATVNFEMEDIKTWDLTALVNAIILNYELSLSEQEQLRKTPVNYFHETIKWGNKPAELRPTLYDFLAHRALDYFINIKIDIPRPADQFELREDFYFAPASEFTGQKLNSTDSSSYKYMASCILQDLLNFRLKDNNENALIDADLKRLKFVYRYSINEQKDDLYLKALETLANKYPNSSVTALVMYEEADFYRDKAPLFKPETETQKYKEYYLKALEICDKVIQQHPKSEGADFCKSIQWNIKAKQLNFTTEEYITPDKKFPVKVDFKNINKIYIRAIALDRKKVDNIKNLYGEDYYKMLIKIGEVTYTSETGLPATNDYNPNSTEIIINSLPSGFYLLSISTGKDFISTNENVAHKLINVTNISYITQKINNYSSEFYVLDRDSGEPLDGVHVDIFKEVYDYKKSAYVNSRLTSLETGKDGFFPLKIQEKDWVRIKVDFSKGKNFLSTSDSYSRYMEKEENITRLTSFFLDRAIYRPGQTVFFKGIMIDKRKDNCDIVTNYNASLQLYDPNYQKISEQRLTTNEYGSFSGSFTIPMGLLNGQYRISNETGTVFFRVEEYKRPTFEVQMKPFDGNYILNDTVKITGTAKMLAGANLTDAKVKYRITRLPQWRGWWYYYIKSQPLEVANGTLTTNDNGEFEIKFKATPDYSMGKSDFIVFSYGIYIDVTDINGETQSTSRSITIGYKALSVSTSMPVLLHKEAISTDYKDGFWIYTQNLNGEFLAAKGKIIVYSLTPPEKVTKERKWDQPIHPLYTFDQWEKQLPGHEFKNENEITNWKKDKQVAEFEFNTADNRYFTIKDIEKWSTGAYCLEISSVDSFKNPVENKNFFTLYSSMVEKIPYAATKWFTVIKGDAEPGETAKFIIGSGYTGVNMFYEIEHKNKITEKKWLRINNEQKIIEIPVREEHRGNFTVNFAFMKDNAFYTFSHTVTVPYSNKQLDLEFATFRDKLQPGESEEWRIKLKGPKGEKVAAEMLAAMYDQSLDKFAANYWYLDIYNRYYSSIHISSSPLNTGMGVVYSPDEASPYVKSYIYNSFNWFGFSYYGYSGGRYAEGVAAPAMYKTADTKNKKEASRDETTTASQVSAEKSNGEEVSEDKAVGGVVDGKKNGTTGKQEDMSDVKVRTNFNETAFFYPNLYTNDSGEVIVSFRIPESLTRWKMMGFAHTKDLKYGFIENKLVTQKELMVMPNAPRFFRENDLMEFPVKITSLTDRILNGQAQIMFFDAATMKEIQVLSNDINRKDFSLKPQMNTLITWKLKIPESVSSITYRIMAKADKFSDGEEKVIPVLTNRMLVTESLPLPVRGKQTKTFELSKLTSSGSSTTLKNHKLTLEFTSNPAWYAVQALPYIMEYPYECNEQLFSRFYANSIAINIANSSPDIKRIFELWRTSKKGESLMSNLEKNQELKSLLLEETPWVLQAQNENERKHRVGLLFELNRMNNEMRTAFNKLEQAQVYNGAWPWFKGMPEDRYITQHVICGLGKLMQLKAIAPEYTARVNNMAAKAVVFLDGKIQRDYEELKKYYNEREMKENHLSYTAIHYLYTRSFFKTIPIQDKAKQAFEYFKGQAEKYWTSQGIYADGMIALALKRYGNEKDTKDIIKSLKELSLTNEELGMYWKNNTGGYYWYQAPIETQALMVEVFHEVANDEASVNDLKVWLLKQKQTQDWKTTKATVEAIYAILLRGKDWLTDNIPVEIKLGGKKVQEYNGKEEIYKEAEAGTGYIKTSWNTEEIKPEMGKVTLTKTNEGVSWGALYWQYFEQLDKITPHETPLKLNKKLFIERIGKSGKTIEPISDKAKLKIGDKVIVRIELRVDRQMEYVHMKDMRASGFEPINVLSYYKYQDGLGYYESTKDAATNFFISYLPKGTFVFEYPLRVTHKGDFSNGITTIQCMYAPEFTSHSEGIRVNINE